MAAVNTLQQDMIALRTLVESRRTQPSHVFSGDVDNSTETITNSKRRLSELDTLKLDMQIMQQRINSLEESRLEARRSSTVLDPTQNPRQPSPASAISPSEASLNKLLLSATQTLMSSHLDGLHVPNAIAFDEHNKVNRRGSSSRGIRSTRKARTFPAYKPSLSNGRAGRGIHNSKNMPPPSISCFKGLKNKIVTRRSSAVGRVSTDGTKATLITGIPTPTISTRIVSQAQEASTSNRYFQKEQENPEYDDELVDDRRLHPSTGNFPKPTSKAPHQHKDQTYETASQSPSCTIQRQNSIQMPPPPLPPPRPHTPVPSSSENTPTPPSTITTHHDSKRRKITAFEAANNAPSGSSTTEVMESRSVSGGQQQYLLVRIDGNVDYSRTTRLQDQEGMGAMKKRGRE